MQASAPRRSPRRAADRGRRGSRRFRHRPWQRRCPCLPSPGRRAPVGRRIQPQQSTERANPASREGRQCNTGFGTMTRSQGRPSSRRNAANRLSGVWRSTRIAGQARCADPGRLSVSTTTRSKPPCPTDCAMSLRSRNVTPWKTVRSSTERPSGGALVKRCARTEGSAARTARAIVDSRRRWPRPDLEVPRKAMVLARVILSPSRISLSRKAGGQKPPPSVKLRQTPQLDTSDRRKRVPDTCA